MFLFDKLQLTLVKKLIISFAISGICMLTGLVYTVSGLRNMHEMEVEIAEKDLSAATITITLREMMLAQERYVGRYEILHQPELRELYHQNNENFRSRLESLQKVYSGSGLDLLVAGFRLHSALSERILSGNPVNKDAMGRAAAQVASALDFIRSDQQKTLDNKLKEEDERETKIVTWSIGLATGGASLSFIIAFLMIYSFSTSIGKLQKATHRIAAGDFDHDPGIISGDEIGALSKDFKQMAERLKVLEQLSLDASPLTRLPGNIAIERSINRRLREQTSFTMCYLDLDNFKSYNDRYGYIRASEILKKTGEVIHEAVKRLNDPDAFIGHIGGDDFVVIIDARLAKEACQQIIVDFDAMIPAYYSDEDRLAGCIEGVDRYGVPRVFPLISISIAALNCQPGNYATAAEIATAAAAVKDRVKESIGSNYIIVREAGKSET
ncbi:MAG: diguanylate cyclase [Geobacteraceae bacterium]|nr:diguanylate cyclase [Geobacteraceae bacterium]